MSSDYFLLDWASFLALKSESFVFGSVLIWKKSLFQCSLRLRCMACLQIFYGKMISAWQYLLVIFYWSDLWGWLRATMDLRLLKNIFTNSNFTGWLGGVVLVGGKRCGRQFYTFQFDPETPWLLENLESGIRKNFYVYYNSNRQSDFWQFDTNADFYR